MTLDRSKISWNGWGWTDHEDAAAANQYLWPWLSEELGMPSLLATPARPLEEIPLPTPRLSSTHRDELIAIVGASRASDNTFERVFHALGRSYHDLLRLRSGTIASAPDLIVFPNSASEVLALLSCASRRGIAVVPYGGGTSVVGGVSARGRNDEQPVVTIDLTGMARLLTVDAEGLTASAQAGIDGPALEDALKPSGVTLGHFPQSFEFSTLGGWIAHAGAGQGSNGYGRSQDWLLGVELATPRGLMTIKPVPAASAGPNLASLVLGSEGAFGIITQATFRVHRFPADRVYCAYLFRDFASGIDAIRRSVQQEIPATMLRLSDREETRFYRAFGALGRAPSATSRAAALYLRARRFDEGACVLIAGFEGEKSEVAGARRRFHAITKSANALSIGESQGRRWLAGRFHGPYLRDPLMNRGVGVDTLETAIGWKQLPSLYGAVRRALEEAIAAMAPRAGAKGIVMCHVSHSYPDGASLYFTFLFPRALSGEVEQWRAIKKAATDAIIANGGALSHHHGVGEDHLPWMVQEKSPLGVDVLWAIKTALDPNGILNPGKLIPPLKARN